MTWREDEAHRDPPAPVTLVVCALQSRGEAWLGSVQAVTQGDLQSLQPPSLHNDDYTF